MIVDNRITEYLHSLETSRGELLDTIEKKAIEDGVPIIRSETAALLRSLTAALRPENILEIGTAVGYPAVDGTVPALHCKTGLDYIPILEHIIGNKHGSYRHQV